MAAVTSCIRVELDEEEEAELYFICGYVSHQEGLSSDEILAPEALAPSQFTTLISRGKLRHPPLWLFAFSQFAYDVFKKLRSDCAVKMQRLFQSLYNIAVKHAR